MILLAILFLLLLGGVLAWAADRLGPLWSRWVALVFVAAGLVLSVVLWLSSHAAVPPSPGEWTAELRHAWIPAIGASLHVGADGLSLLLVVLTLFLGVISVACSWTEISERVGFFHFNLLWVLAGIVGVFTALDLFLFYVFWELMLVPMYFLISIWGHENRRAAAYKFFLFTQAGGLLMLVAILALYFLHGCTTGVYTFDYPALLGTALPGQAGMWIMLGFFVAFAVKLPAVPLHTWLPDAHTEAPTAGSVILAGLLLKTGAYGLLRFVVPLFPGPAAAIAPAAMVLGVIGVLYGAMTAFGQQDLKRLVAYTSVSHLGFVLLGIFAGTEQALQGAVLQMLCHGLSTGALFIVAGSVQERIHTRDLDRMGGFWTTAPRMGGAALFFALASLGLPGLGNFAAEFLVLLGAYQVSVPLVVAAVPGLVLSAAYALRIIQRVFHGPPAEQRTLRDLSLRETAVMIALMLPLLWLGLFPQTVLSTSAPALSASLSQRAATGLTPVSGHRGGAP